MSGSIWLSVAGAGVGMVLGALGYGLLGQSDRVDPLRSALIPDRRAPPCPRAEEQVAELSVSQARIAFLEGQITSLRAEEVALVGHPAPWPDALPASYRHEAAARELVDRALRDSPFRVEHVDCDEYPCLVGVSWTSDAGAEGGPHGPEHSVQRLAREGVEVKQAKVDASTQADGRVRSIEWSMLVPDDAPKPDWGQRLRYRLDLNERSP